MHIYQNNIFSLPQIRSRSVGISFFRVKLTVGLSLHCLTFFSTPLFFYTFSVRDAYFSFRAGSELEVRSAKNCLGRNLVPRVLSLALRGTRRRGTWKRGWVGAVFTVFTEEVPPSANCINNVKVI